MVVWNAEQKLKRLQTMVDQGIFIEDPDGLLWMSDKARVLVESLDANERLQALLKEKAKDDDDYKTGFWTCIYVQYMGEFTSPEIGEAVSTFKGWENAIAEDRLREWSMGLRLR